MEFLLDPRLLTVFEIWGYFLAAIIVLVLANRLAKVGKPDVYPCILPKEACGRIYQNDEAEEEFGYRAHA